jgi:HK97 family phage portal protein
MKIFDNILNRLRPQTAVKEKAVNLSDYRGWVTLFGEDFLKELDYYVSFCYSSINARARNIAKAKVYLYQQNASRDKRTKEIINHPFVRIVNGFNLYNQSFPELLYLTMVNLDMYGNCLWFYTRDVLGAVDGFYILPTSRMRVKYNSDRTRIEGYEMFGTNSKFYSVDEIIHFQLLNYKNPFWGTPTVDAVKTQLDIEYLQRVYQKAFYKNDASLGTVLSFKENLTNEVFNRLKAQLQERYQGVDNAKKFMVLEGGAEAKPFTTSPKEADYIKSRESVRDEIFAIFGTSKVVMGYTEGVNFASSLTALNNFMINTIIPIAELFIVTRLNTFIKKEFDERLYCKFEFDIMSDPAQKTNDMKMLSERGAVTINELREQYNYDYVDDPRADELFIDKNEDNTDEDKEPEAEEQPAEPENSNSENQTNENE